MITAITGKVGSGKNLLTVQRMYEYARRGRRVVANFHVDFAPVVPFWWSWVGREVPKVEQLPGRPTVADVLALGKGGVGEHEAGLLVLDEVGPLLNSRTWQQSDRAEFIDWLLHSRKLAWDIFLIVQHIGIVDKQIRTAVVESMVTCKRFDRLRVPLIRVPLPRVHMAVERYGTEPTAPIAQREFYRGDRFFRCYDTTEIVGQAVVEAVSVPAQPAPALPSWEPPPPANELQEFWREVWLLCNPPLRQAS